MTARCSICSSERSKYRCTACMASSCSLVCFKSHDAECPAETEALHSHHAIDASENVVEEDELALESLPVRKAQADIEDLFKKYPSLRSRLRWIYETTLRPEAGEEAQQYETRSQNSRSRGRGTHRFNRTDYASSWTQEKGFNLGMKHLQRSLEEQHEESEGLKAFTELIRKQADVNGPVKGASSWH